MYKNEGARPDQTKELGRELGIQELRTYLAIYNSGAIPITAEKISQEIFGRPYDNHSRAAIWNILSRIRGKLGKESIISHGRNQGFTTRRGEIDTKFASKIKIKREVITPPPTIILIKPPQA